MNLRKHAAVTVAALALGLSAAPVASAVAADAPTKAPCATQQTQLDRAEAKLEALTA